jgi:type IX secretion system PorP/SprF family membrane protein
MPEIWLLAKKCNHKHNDVLVIMSNILTIFNNISINYMYKFLALFSGIFFLALSSIMAQDKHFSQYFASPLTLNPAFTGKFDGDFRLSGNYRNQWPGINNAFVTSTIGIDGSILPKKIRETDKLSVGLLGYTDRSGNGILSLNGVAASVAYHLALDEDGYHQLGVGFQGAYVSRRFDVAKAIFADQLTPLGFTGVTSEVFNNSQINKNYFDMNVGIMYTGSTDGENSFYLGGAYYHVNQPNESFRGANFSLPGRMSISAGGTIPVNNNVDVHVSGLFMQQAAANTASLGGTVQYYVTRNEYDPPVSVYLGSWYRYKDALIPYVGFEFSNLRIGYTRDFTVSRLAGRASGVNGNEISLIYVRKPKLWKSLPCPKF